MRIGELAAAADVSVRALRYYEQQGLLRADRGADGLGHRRYDDDAVTTVGHIRTLLAAGVPTSLIYELLPCAEGPGARLARCAAPVLRDQLRRVDDRLAALAIARARLVDVLDSAERPRELSVSS